MSEIVFDIEANGLQPTQIWCVCTKDITTGEAKTFRQAADFLSWLNSYRGGECTLYGHNAIDYDYRVLNELWRVDFSGFTCRDTLVLSRLARPDRDKGHSVDAWGQKFGRLKPEHDDWTRFSPEMLHRCREDVEIQCKILEALKEELEGFSEESIALEHEVQRIIMKQCRDGWLLDVRKCYDLMAIIKERKLELEETVYEVFKPLPVFEKEVHPKYKKDGSLSVLGLRFLGDRWEEVGGPFSKIDWPEFNMNSGDQIARYLLRAGWKPWRQTEAGKWATDEKALEEIQGIPEADYINEYRMLTKRSSMIQGWLDKVGEDNRIRGYVNTLGTGTTRMTHSDPNLAQVTADGKPYGREMRECFIVPEGRVMVGVDASQIQLRVLAHYMDDADYVRAVCEGREETRDDVHTLNGVKATIIPPNLSELSQEEFSIARKKAKTFIYAFLFGAQAPKIASIVGCSVKKGGEIRDNFLRNLPGLGKLMTQSQNAAKRGWVHSLDGRKIHIRSAHSALNYVIQGGEAVIMKKALCLLDEYVKIWDIDMKFLGNIHDEWQMECNPEDADKLGHLAVACLRATGDNLKLRCPLDGEYHIGKSWAETH